MKRIELGLAVGRSAVYKCPTRRLRGALLFAGLGIFGGSWSLTVHEQPYLAVNLLPAERASSFMDLPLDKLAKIDPDLKNIHPAMDQANLPALLAKVGQNVASFFSTFPNIGSDEMIREQRLQSDGSIDESAVEDFRYIALAKPGHSQEDLIEYRTNDKGEPVRRHQLRGAYMLTEGFASSIIHFDLVYQSDSIFRDLGSKVWHGRTTEVVAFAQRPEKAREVGAVLVGKEKVPIYLQGIAWIDPSSGWILALRTDLLHEEREIGLERQTTQVEFKGVHFKESSSTLWLPSSVVVTAVWNSQTFRNMHTYSNCHLFEVQTKEKPQSPESNP